MSRITFNIAAKCDKAGRAQNQDNFWVCPNLDEINDQSSIGTDTEVELTDKGALLVVADGMGGMKSGEKASELVIEGIKKMFSHIPDSILSDDNAIISFMKDSIVKSDEMIKSFAKGHRESEGLGSTVALVWLLGEKAYCCWCGDSRIYCYNPQNSLVRLSHDHSYVQSLVDEGKISEEEAFDHPDGNIITRSLGDNGEAANPESKIYPIHRRDVLLLCSDGLCGILNDEQIENILAENCTSSEDALKALWKKGMEEGWSDNATVEVACITDGGITPTRKAIGYNNKVRPKTDRSIEKIVKENTQNNLNINNFWRRNIQYFIIIAIVALIALFIVIFSSNPSKNTISNNQEFEVEQPQETLNDNPIIDQVEESNIKPGMSIPVQPSKPNKPEQTTLPNKPGTSDSNNGSENTIPSQQHSPSIPQTVKVTEGYLNLMKNTYNSIGMINKFILNANKRRHFTSAEANALHDFQFNANELNNKPDVKILDSNQKNILDKINSVSRRVAQALKDFATYDDEPQNQHYNNHDQSQPERQDINQHNQQIELPNYRNI